MSVTIGGSVSPVGVQAFPALAGAGNAAAGADKTDQFRRLHPETQVIVDTLNLVGDGLNPRNSVYLLVMHTYRLKIREKEWKEGKKPQER